MSKAGDALKAGMPGAIKEHKAKQSKLGSAAVTDEPLKQRIQFSDETKAKLDAILRGKEA